MVTSPLTDGVAGDEVEYTIEVRSNFGNTEKHPRLAPAITHRFVVGEKRQ